eukprot:3326145-Pyramimonas_sp.AAC.1
MDGVVVRQIPFPRVMPQVIQFERKHLNTSEQQESIQLLHENNYTVFKGGAPDFDGTLYPCTCTIWVAPPHPEAMWGLEV